MLTNTRIFARLVALVVVLLVFIGGVTALGLNSLQDIRASLKIVYEDRAVRWRSRQRLWITLVTSERLCGRSTQMLRQVKRLRQARFWQQLVNFPVKLRC